MFFSSTNSEEAKSTTWLHPVTGEAVITGHRKTPGKQCGQPEEGGGGLLSTVPAKTHAAPAKGYPRVTAESLGRRKKTGGSELWREPRNARKRGGDFFSLQQSNSLSLLRSPFPPPLLLLSRPLRTASESPPPPTSSRSTWTLCDTLFKSSVT